MTNKVLLIFFLFAISSASLSKDINTECKKFIKKSGFTENNANQKEKLLFEKGVLWKVITPKNKVNYLRINIYPDGGISRIRAFGNFVK